MALTGLWIAWLQPLQMESPEALPRTWMNRLVEVFQPISIRADRLAAMRLLAGLERADLELAAALVSETLIDRGTRLTIQGRPSEHLWLVLEGQALVSADARPMRVVTGGDVIGLASMLLAAPCLETTVALTPIRAFETDAGRLAELMSMPPIRSRLAEAAGLSAIKRSARRRSSAAG